VFNLRSPLQKVCYLATLTVELNLEYWRLNFCIVSMAACKFLLVTQWGRLDRSAALIRNTVTTFRTLTDV